MASGRPVLIRRKPGIFLTEVPRAAHAGKPARAQASFAPGPSARAPPRPFPSLVIVAWTSTALKPEGKNPSREGVEMSFHDFYLKLVAEHPANSLFKALQKLSLLDDLKVMATADGDDDGGGDMEPGPGWIVWGSTAPSSPEAARA